MGPGHQAPPLAPAEPAEVGEPLTGRPVAQLLLPENAGVGLGHRTRLDRGERGPRLLDLLDHRDQVVVGPVGPPRRIQVSDHRDHLCQSRRRAGLRVELRDRHTNIEAVATDNPAAYPQGSLEW